MSSNEKLNLYFSTYEQFRNKNIEELNVIIAILEGMRIEKTITAEKNQEITA